jgi:mono/diheme cytochrome c family protein
MRLFVLIGFATLGCLIYAAPQESAAIKIVPASKTSPASGVEMFNTYCAVCHGKSGKGDGPAAAALKKAPADLTQITRRNEGKFPELKVKQSITMDVPINAHGDREMPVWGPVFKSLESGDAMWRMRAQNLTDYVRSIQAK